MEIIPSTTVIQKKKISTEIESQCKKYTVVTFDSANERLKGRCLKMHHTQQYFIILL